VRAALRVVRLVHSAPRCESMSSRAFRPLSGECDLCEDYLGIGEDECTWNTGLPMY
jgi:hypothetical protein